jgi:hypothetical protein
MSETLSHRLVAALRSTAESYAVGDQVAPCAVLWTDPDRLWESTITALQAIMPELFVLGSYSPEHRAGPALWLRCIDARQVPGAPPDGMTPLFYLPGISREQLRTAENCAPELAALVELQYRGALWLHVNGKDWTPYAFLVSKHGGLSLEVAKDQLTIDSMGGALSALLSVPITQLQGRLDSDFFNALLAPDATGLLLNWLSDTETFKQRRSDAEWKAFCQKCKADFGLDPAKDGPLKAAQRLAARAGSWLIVWKRFAEAPANYPGIVEWLRRAAPQEPGMFDSSEVWPSFNESEERKLQQALELLIDQPQDESIRKIAELEAQHAGRREHPWQPLGLSPLATALEPLAHLAALCQTSPGAPTPQEYAEYYFNEGWRVDGAALSTMSTIAAHGTPAQQSTVMGCLRVMYLPWLDATARHLQKLVHGFGQSVAKRTALIEPEAGRLVLFADGLRMDVAKQLATRLAAVGIESTSDWDWSTIPAVTASAKPAASPIADGVKGVSAEDQFATRLQATGQLLTQDRFIATLKEQILFSI